MMNSSKLFSCLILISFIFITACTDKFGDEDLVGTVDDASTAFLTYSGVVDGMSSIVIHESIFGATSPDIITNLTADFYKNDSLLASDIDMKDYYDSSTNKIAFNVKNVTPGDVLEFKFKHPDLLTSKFRGTLTDVKITAKLSSATEVGSVVIIGGLGSLDESDIVIPLSKMGGITKADIGKLTIDVFVDDELKFSVPAHMYFNSDLSALMFTIPNAGTASAVKFDIKKDGVSIMDFSGTLSAESITPNINITVAPVDTSDEDAGDVALTGGTTVGYVSSCKGTGIGPMHKLSCVLCEKLVECCDELSKCNSRPGSSENKKNECVAVFMTDYRSQGGHWPINAHYYSDSTSNLHAGKELKELDEGVVAGTYSFDAGKLNNCITLMKSRTCTDVDGRIFGNIIDVTTKEDWHYVENLLGDDRSDWETHTCNGLITIN